MDTANIVQTLDEAVCISHHANTLEKGMNPTILFSNYGQIVEQTRLFKLGMATGLGERNSKFKPVKIRLRIEHISYSARAEGFGKFINYSDR